MMFKKVFAAAASALAIAAFAGNAMARDTLRVGTEPTFAPFEFLDTKTQEFSGFDIDLIKAVADKAGYDIKVMNMGFDALIPALSAGTIDVIASGISITEERQKKVDFTSPYYQSGLSYLVRKADAEKIKTFADLKGKTLAVQIGTTAPPTPRTSRAPASPPSTRRARPSWTSTSRTPTPSCLTVRCSPTS